MDRFAKAIRNTTLSSAFSGVGGAENSLEALYWCVHHFNPTNKRPTFTYAVEKNRESMGELATLENAPECLFGEIEEFVVAAVKDVLLPRAASMTYDQLEKIFTTGKAIGDMAWCYKHKAISAKWLVLTTIYCVVHC